MKHTLLLFFLLLSWPGLAQIYSCQEPVSRQQRTADSLLAPLDKS